MMPWRHQRDNGVSTSTIAAQHGSGLRPWRDLSKWRLFLGLALAPVPPIALGALILQLLGGGLIFASFGAILAAAETWSLPVGAIFLITSRFRGVLRRAHCLLLGTFLAFSLPSAAYLAGKAIDWSSGAGPSSETAGDDFNTDDDDFHGPSDGGLVFIIGLILIPFGTLGGWVFWQVGVYPARPKVIDVAPVFD